MIAQQVKSKERVVNHGEVFTAQREVKAMCDLVKDETERIESRFLEPACGNGNFLAEVLNRKLKVVSTRYKKNFLDYERYAVLAISSLYGIDILQDNVEECRERLFKIWDKEYTKNVKNQANEQCREAVRFILKKNIVCGDALTMKKNDGTPIIFSEWNLISGNQMKRREFAFEELVAAEEVEINLFTTEYDEKTKAIVPKPVKEYPLTDYRQVQNYE
ncbi:DNA methyltransferase [Megamonas hypermegale]|uniref:DNA methyltransferase n=1 Tax=Megamonas hypermegale TaxID=158847 RepID=UPI003207F009